MYNKTSERSEQGYIFAPGELASARWGEDRREPLLVFKSGGRSGVSFLLVTFEPHHPWRGPPSGRAKARPILLPAKLSLDKQRQIRPDRIWTDAVCPQGEGQGWPESKVTCRGSATHKLYVTAGDTK